MNTTNIFWEEETTEIVWLDQRETETSDISTIEQDSTWYDAWQDIEEVELELVDDDEDITEHLLDDKTLAETLNDICTNATKTITHKDWRTEEFPNYEARLWWLKIALKLKWHFREKPKRRWPVDAIYQYKLK